MDRITRKSTTDRKKEIVEATLALIGEKGIEALRTSEIAEKVGFSEAALYKHFSTKKEIIKTTIQTAGNKLISSITNAIEEVDTEDEVEKLQLVLETHFRFIRNNPGITRLLFSDEVHFNREDLRKELLGIIERYHDFVEKLIENGMKKGQIKENLDTRAATSIYFGLVQSQILFWSLSGGKKSLEDQLENLWNHYSKLLAREE